jgi:hypothetical protein
LQRLPDLEPAAFISSRSYQLLTGAQYRLVSELALNNTPLANALDVEERVPFNIQNHV